MITHGRKVLLSLFIFLFFIQFNCSTKSKLLAHKELNYPSGSAIECLDNKLFLLGDDAGDLLILNLDFDVIDSVNLITTIAKRIPKDEKPDFESLTSATRNDTLQLILLGSGSFDTLRNKAIMINTVSNRSTWFRLDTFYSRLRSAGIKELNIEGLCKSKNGFIIGNRGNTSYRENHLVIASENFWNDQENTFFKILKIETGTDQELFSGISGLEYSEEKDLLILSVSSENTANAYDDGEIGKSYLWIVENFSSKKNSVSIKPDAIIDLGEVDRLFTNHKIESVCIISENHNEFDLALVADDDKGTSLLFRIRIMVNSNHSH